MASQLQGHCTKELNECLCAVIKRNTVHESVLVVCYLVVMAGQQLSMMMMVLCATEHCSSMTQCETVVCLAAVSVLDMVTSCM